MNKTKQEIITFAKKLAKISINSKVAEQEGTQAYRKEMFEKLVAKIESDEQFLDKLQAAIEKYIKGK